MPFHLRCFVLSNSERFMNKFFSAIDCFESIDLYYVDTYRMYIENKPWDQHIEVRLAGEGSL